MQPIRLAMAQMNPTVGALDSNRDLIGGWIERARDAGANLVLFPELVLSGYPPEDLLRNPEFLADTRLRLESLVPATRGILAVVGVPLAGAGGVQNAAAILHDGRWVDTYVKNALPNYGVFDEQRYFQPGVRCPVYTWGSLRFGVSICEDIWVPAGVPAVQASGGAQLLLNLSASPYHAGKGREREALMRQRARQHGAAIAYLNLIGGQDELVFDGDSLIVTASGEIAARCGQFEEELLLVDLDPEWLRAPRDRAPSQPELEPLRGQESRLILDQVSLDPPPTPSQQPRLEIRNVDRLDGDAEVYAALCLGTRDYVEKNGFQSVVLGLSGGIDSALTAVLAVDALGADRVLGVTMPSRFNTAETRGAARELAENLEMPFREIPIETTYGSFLQALEPFFAGTEPDVTEENLQARIRGTLLMALSNKEGRLLLTTGNKSELAVGYCTLYGDMAGGFAVLKDVPKTLVYRLSHYRNMDGSPIPEKTLTLPPSAELRADQKDSDSLPPYELLDQIIEAKVERDEPLSGLIERGLDPKWVRTVYRWIDANEYKRRQAPPGIKITPKAFGRDRRYPITNRYLPVS